MVDAGFQMTEGLKIKWKPDSDAIAKCRAHGRMVVRQWALRDLSQDVVRPVLIKPAPVIAEQVSCGTRETESAQETVVNPSPVAQEQCQVCTVCQWIYDPEQGEINQGVAPGKPWDEVPDYFLCPECGLGKAVFEPVINQEVA